MSFLEKIFSIEDTTSKSSDGIIIKNRRKLNIFGFKINITLDFYKNMRTFLKSARPQICKNVIQIINNGGGTYTNLSICAIFKNEPDIKEWIEFHKLVGVERFYLYDNESDDNAQEILRPYIDDGTVIYHYAEGKCLQNAVYRDAIYRYRNKTKWLAIIDIDEYIVPVKKQNINEILRDFENYPGLGINWVMFDSNGLVSRPDKLVIEAYTRAESEDNLFLKTISQTEKVKYIFDSHFCFYYKKEHPVNENFEKVSSVISEPWSSKSKTHSSNKIRINHYHTKSYEDYIRKRLIGYADSNMQRPVVDGQIYARNYKRDYVIQKYLPTLKEKMGLK